MARFIHNLNQGTPEWEQWRRSGWGGSDLPVLLGVSPFPEPTQNGLFLEKAFGVRSCEPNFAMHRGTRLEPIGRQWYQEKYGVMAPPVCVEHETIPWARVSLDGVIDDEFLGQYILELKWPNWKVHSAALEGIVPEYYAIQCQYQMLVTGYDMVHFVSCTEATQPTKKADARFTPEQRMAVVPVRPDTDLRAKILEAGEQCWEIVKELKARFESYEEAKWWLEEGGKDHGAVGAEIPSEATW